ncbi:hypothetical protein V5O48_004783 [Marasmius crinis-equi]|uniref:Uncharacterized protein n=1 Tax=Marasmius crinis-equi TaxID=585013 RepID=A0ABR3FP46_9AGAR
MLKGAGKLYSARGKDSTKGPLACSTTMNFELEALKTNFREEIYKPPTYGQLSAWYSEFGDWNRIACVPFTGAYITAACSNCELNGLCCGRSLHERQWHIQQSLNIDSDTYSHFLQIVLAEDRYQQPQSSYAATVGQTVDPSKLLTTSSTSRPKAKEDPPLLHVPTPGVPQSHLPSSVQSQALVCNSMRPSQVVHVQSPIPMRPSGYSQFTQPGSSSSNILQNPSISQISPDSSSLFSALDALKSENQKLRDGLASWQSAHHALQDDYTKLSRDRTRSQNEGIEHTQRAKSRIRQLLHSERAKEEEVERLNKKVQSLNTQVEGLTSQVESDLQRKLYLESELKRLREQLEGKRPGGSEKANSANEFRKVEEDMRKKEEAYHQERRDWEERVKKKDEDISEELSRSNRLIASRSKDYTLLTSLMKSYTNLRDQVQTYLSTPSPMIAERFDELSAEMHGLAEKMRGDMLGALCSENAVSPGEQRFKDKDTPSRKRLKRLRMADTDTDAD